MKKILLIIMGFMFIVGCSQHNTPPGSSFVDRTITDYTFENIAKQCTIYDNIIISNETESPCEGNQTEFSMFYTEDNGWNVMCCEYEEICFEEDEPEYNDLCSEDLNTKYTGYVFNDRGFYMGYCCDENGKNCYVDMTVDISNTSTICDNAYQKVLFAPDYNNDTWSSMCCIGGLIE